MPVSRRDFIKKSVTAGIALGTATALPISASPAPGGRRRKIKPAKRVIIFTFDGIRVDGLKTASTPTIDALISTGAASFATRDVMPSVTLPNYTSHLLGAGPEVHGVANNSWTVDKFDLPAVVRDEEGYFPSVFQVLKENVPGIKTAFYYNWKPLSRPYNPKYFDEDFSAGDEEYAMLCDKAMDFIRANSDEQMFMFLYTVHTDSVGHHHSWMSPEYIESIEEADAEIGRVVEMLKAEGLYEDTHLMFISDHGGVGNGHGGVSEVEMIVPWVIAGPGIRKGFEITEPNNTVNTASTVLSLFGVEQPLCWTGEVPQSIFEE